MPQLDLLWFLSKFFLAWSLLFIVMIIFMKQCNYNLENKNKKSMNSNNMNKNTWTW